MFNTNKDALVKKVIYPRSDLRYYANQKWLKHNYDENIPKHILKHMKYYRIAIAAVNQDGYALKYIDQNWALKKPQLYFKIALAAVRKNGNALNYVNKEWAVENPKTYYDIALAAVKENGLALDDVNEEWEVKNPKPYYGIVLAAVKENGLAFRYAGEVFRNNIKIAIWSLIDLDRKCLKNKSVFSISYKIYEMFSIPCEPSENILLYLYMLSNENVSNNFKNVLFNFFIQKFEHTDKFALYKNIFECYLTLSNGYKNAFPDHKLLANLSNDDSKELHMFLSVADPYALKKLQSAAKDSVLKNTKLAKLLNRNNNHNDIIKDYLEKDTHNLNTHNLKCIKNYNIYSHWLPNNLFVINYDKIINMMKNTPLMQHTSLMKNTSLNNILIKLILYYSRIEDLLALSEALNLGYKLEVKYLNMHLAFQQPDGDVSNGIEALVDAIQSKSNEGFLSNTTYGKYDSSSTTYTSVDIELSKHGKLIEK